MSVAASSRNEIRKLNVFKLIANFIRLGSEGHLRCKRNAEIPRKLGCFALFAFPFFGDGCVASSRCHGFFCSF